MKYRFNYHFIGSKYVIHLTFALVILSLVLDSSLIKIVPFYNSYSDIGKREIVFVTLIAVLSIIQVIILNHTLGSESPFTNKRDLKSIRRALLGSQLLLLLILSSLILQVIFISSVFTNLLTVLVTLSYSLSSIIFGVLCYNFWRWYATNKNPVVLSYAICCSTLLFNLLISTIFIDILLQQRQEILFPQLGLSDRFIASDPVMIMLHYLYISSSILAFTATWTSSVVLLYHYSARRGKIRSWILLSLPLVFFISQFVGLMFGLFPTFVGESPVFFGNFLTIVYAISRPAGGILFGLAFWVISKYVRGNETVQDYLIRSAYGFILLFVSNQAIILITTNYPPFGISTVTFMPIASYLVFSGIHSIAVSVSQDITLRKSIKNSVEKEIHFIDSIGEAQMNRHIQNKVLTMTRKLSSKIHDETGITDSLSDEDIKLYIKEAIAAKIKNRIREG